MFCFEAEGHPRMFVEWGLCPYKGCKTTVSNDGELSSFFSVKVGVHQGSALSPLLFITVMDLLTENVRDGWSWCMQTILFCVGNR